MDGGGTWVRQGSSDQWQIANSIKDHIEFSCIHNRRYGVVIKTSNGDETTAINTNTETVKNFILKQNYPNPFNPVTNLEFGISKLGFVSLKIYDVLGKEVAVIVNNNVNPGTYKYNFDGSNLVSGVYFYRLEAGDFTDVKRMVLVK
ncbi:MAG: T9SS type A sorting domain-containing protein [Ignavibacteria bacterium]|nr:T9SS type A sorting domain-containing protein [Ignavibacteria bacterium]